MFAEVGAGYETNSRGDVSGSGALKAVRERMGCVPEILSGFSPHVILQEFAVDWYQTHRNSSSDSHKDSTGSKTTHRKVWN